MCVHKALNYVFKLLAAFSTDAPADRPTNPTTKIKAKHLQHKTK